MRLQRQQWRQTKRQLLQTGMLDLPASAKAAGRRTRDGAAAADLTDTDSEAEDELDSDHPEGEDSSALTEAFRDAAPKGALLGVVLKMGPTCTRSMRLSREALPSPRPPASRRLHLRCWAGELLCAAWDPSQSRGTALHSGCWGRPGMVSGVCCHHANSIACAWQRLLGVAAPTAALSGRVQAICP